jgi:hypothetical protein
MLEGSTQNAPIDIRLIHSSVLGANRAEEVYLALHVNRTLMRAGLTMAVKISSVLGLLAVCCATAWAAGKRHHGSGSAPAPGEFNFYFLVRCVS